jgi:2-polyprenyl-6-methoxyphenol hydroxylase-like FAD-dependent oxidoreductase
VLVGDAGHFKDFTPAQGISDALRQAKTLAESISAGLSHGGELDAQLHRWWRWRDSDAYDMYWLAKDMGQPGVATPLVTSVLRQIAESEAGPQELLRVLNHEIPPSKLFTTARLLRAAASAMRDQPREIPATVREIVGAATAEIHRATRRHRLPRSGNAKDARR